MPNLGISIADRATLIGEVSIVFHAAATVRFDEKIKLAGAINVRSLKEMIHLSLKMSKLKVRTIFSVRIAVTTLRISKFDQI